MSEAPATAKEDQEDSLWKKYLKGWHFRARKPTYVPGDEGVVYVSEYDEEEQRGIIRLGDSRLIVNAPPQIDHKRVRIRVTDFDEDTHTGEAEVLEIVGEPAF